MPVSAQEKARPIFILSTGRAGSTILTWSLGQHPNIIPQEESNWLGPFAIDAAVGYKRGTLRGERGQLSANFIERDELLAALGDAIDRLLVSHRHKFENPDLRGRAGWALPPFPVSRAENEPKRRWVDGTPEYSLYVCALRKLFPEALFVHLVRDVADVVRSLLNFRPYGNRLVHTEQEAYEYWLRRARAGVEAERAYGPQRVYRMQYADLVTQPDKAMASLLKYVGEPYAPECLEPLKVRINSSEVGARFDERDPSTDPEVREQAKLLSVDLLTAPPPRAADPGTAAKLEADFDQRVEYFSALEGRLGEATDLIRRLQQEGAVIPTPSSG